MKLLKILIILSIVFIFSGCSIFNEDYLSSRQTEEIRINSELQKLYLINAKPVFSVAFPEGGNLPAGTKIEYFGEIKYQPIKISAKQYHPMWNILATAIPFAFGYLTAREYRFLAEDRLNDENTNYKGQTITLGDKGVVNIGSGTIANTDTKGSYNSASDNSTKITDSYKMLTDQSDNSTHLFALDKSDKSTHSFSLSVPTTISGNNLLSNNPTTDDHEITTTDDHTTNPYTIFPTTPTPTPAK